jgi:hypothetical protein
MNIKLGQPSFRPALLVWMADLALRLRVGRAAIYKYPKYPSFELGFGLFLRPNAVLITKIFLALAWLCVNFSNL